MGSVSVVTTVKWFWFLIGLAALFAVVVHFAQVFKAYADAKGGELSQLYGKLAWLSILAWICYPVVWLFSEGFASFSVSFEVCAYAILDMVTKVVVSFMVMSGTFHILCRFESTVGWIVAFVHVRRKILRSCKPEALACCPLTAG